MKKWKEPRQYSIVKFDFERLPKSFRNKYPFKPNKLYVYFGEIANMPGHCIVADHKQVESFPGIILKTSLNLVKMKYRPTS